MAKYKTRHSPVRLPAAGPDLSVWTIASREDPSRDSGHRPEIRDVPGNTGRLATLVTVRGTLYK